MYSVTTREKTKQNKNKTRDYFVYDQGASNINSSTVVFNFDVCRLS